jgi:hypothetical protein
VLLSEGLGHGVDDAGGHPVEEVSPHEPLEVRGDLEGVDAHDAALAALGAGPGELDDGDAQGGTADIERDVPALLEAGGQLVVVGGQHAGRVLQQAVAELLLELAGELAQARALGGLDEQLLSVLEEVLDGAAKAVRRAARGQGGRADPEGEHGLEEGLAPQERLDGGDEEVA